MYHVPLETIRPVHKPHFRSIMIYPRAWWLPPTWHNRIIIHSIETNVECRHSHAATGELTSRPNPFCCPHARCPNSPFPSTNKYVTPMALGTIRCHDFTSIHPVLRVTDVSPTPRVACQFLQPSGSAARHHHGFLFRFIHIDTLPVAMRSKFANYNHCIPQSITIHIPALTAP